MTNTTVGFIKELASSLVSNPLILNDRGAWNQILHWLRRPGTLGLLFAANAYVFANQLSHRLFIAKVYEFWKDYDGVKCGTGIGYNQLAIVQGTILLIPLLIIFVSYGIAKNLSGSIYHKQEPLSICGFLQPWIQTSLIWALWLFVLNFILFKLLSRDSDIEDFFAFSLLFIPVAFLGGWLGLALPTIASRNHPKRLVRYIARLALTMGFLLMLPQLLSQAIHIDVPYQTYMKLLWLYKFSVALVLPYLGLMVMSFPLWLRWVDTASENWNN